MKSETHHNHARYKMTGNGQFILWRNLHLGTRGNAGSEYLVQDTMSDRKTRSFDNQMNAECYVQNLVTGLELSPFFGTSAGFFQAKDGRVQDLAKSEKLLTVSLPDYKEIKDS